jgi:hypothetical protein
VFFPLQVTTGGDGGEAGQNEVIEFPWVVLDVESKQIMDEQKLVVRDQMRRECRTTEQHANSPMQEFFRRDEDIDGDGGIVRVNCRAAWPVPFPCFAGEL